MNLELVIKLWVLKKINFKIIFQKNIFIKTFLLIQIYRVCAHYRIPAIYIEDILTDVRTLEDQLGIDFSEEKEAIEEYLKSESDYANLTETTKVLFRAVKWRLSQNDCKNRGYILVNYPFGVEDAKHIFNKCNVFLLFF